MEEEEKTADTCVEAFFDSSPSVCFGIQFSDFVRLHRPSITIFIQDCSSREPFIESLVPPLAEMRTENEVFLEINRQ